MKRLFVLQKMPDKVKKIFIEKLSPYFEIDFSSSFDPEYLEDSMKDTEVCFGSSLPDDVLKSALRLETFQLAGTGADKLNLKLFREKGVTICKTQAHSKYVGEFAVALAHSLTKKIAYFDRQLRANNKGQQKNDFTLSFDSDTLIGKQVGIIGFGHIGKAIQQMLQPFTDHFLITSTSVKSESELSGAIQVSFDSLIQDSDVVFICCPLTPATKDLIAMEAFQASRRESVWINISRAEIINFNALMYALKNKLIGGIAIDNWYAEIPDALFQISSFDNTILSPYRATKLKEGHPNLLDAMDNLLRIGKGEEPRHVVNYDKGY